MTHRFIVISSRPLIHLLLLVVCASGYNLTVNTCQACQNGLPCSSCNDDNKVWIVSGGSGTCGGFITSSLIYCFQLAKIGNVRPAFDPFPEACWCQTFIWLSCTPGCVAGYNPSGNTCTQCTDNQQCASCGGNNVWSQATKSCGTCCH